MGSFGETLCIELIVKARSIDLGRGIYTLLQRRQCDGTPLLRRGSEAGPSENEAMAVGC
jgi:hypothetical protein